MSVTTKIIGYASTAIIFAGMAFGQNNLICSSSLTQAVSGNAAVSISPQVPIELRSEGATELVSDEIFQCNAAPAGATSGQVSATLTAPVTSKAVAGAVTEATLTITPTGGAAVYYQGTVAGTTVLFGATTPVAFPTVQFTVQLSNVRVNVTGQWPNALQPVGESVQLVAQGNGLANVTNIPQITVGNIRNSLTLSGAGAATYIAPGSNTAGTAAGVSSYQVCTVGGGANASGSTGFSVTIGELFAGAFKTQVQTVNGTGAVAVFSVAGIPGSEAGSLLAGATGLPAATGTANSGTRFKLVFAGVPTNAKLTVPTTVTNGSFQIKLTSGTETGAFAAAASGVLTVNASVGGFYTTTAIYEVTAEDYTTTGSFTVPVVATYTANTVIPSATPISVAVSYAPSSATSVANGGVIPAAIPTVPYFANTGTPLNGSTFTACQTTLLFPFVANGGGLDTGLAIANTSTDTLNAGASSVTGQSGSCALTFFPTALTLTNGAVSAVAAGTPVPYTTVSVPTGGTWASGMAGANALGVTGYMIAQCNFLYAHGFAYITYLLGGQNGAAMGYTADVVVAPRAATAVVPETLGQ